MIQGDFIKSQMILFAWREAAHYGGINNMLAVLYVLRNRVKAGWNGSDYLDVIAAAQQSSAHKIESISVPDVRDPNFRRLLSLIDGIHAGTSNDEMTDGALFYADFTNVSEDFKERIIEHPQEHPRVAQVGPVHLFR